MDEENIRPDFAILVYPAYLSFGGSELAANLPVRAKTPPTFMVHTEDDKSFVPGSKLYHAALEAAKVPNELFLCAEGGHGYGVRSKGSERVAEKVPGVVDQGGNPLAMIGHSMNPQSLATPILAAVLLFTSLTKMHAEDSLPPLGRTSAADQHQRDVARV